MARCDVHCPGPGSGLLAVAVTAVGVAVAVETVSAWLLVVLVVLAVACAAGVVWFVVVLHPGDLLWRPGMQVKAPPRVAVEAATTRRAIAPRRVIPGVVIKEEERSERAG